MEKRSLTRIPLTSRGKAATLLSAESGVIYTANISRQGLCFYSETSLPLEAEVILELELSHPSEPVAIEHLHGRVLWKREWEGMTVHGIHLSTPLSRFKNPRAFELTTDLEIRDPTGGHKSADPVRGTDRLTKREHEITRLIAQGANNRQIARRLSISIKTVETHRGNIYSKLKVHNAVQLLRVLEKSGAWVVNRDQAPRRSADHPG
jgi:DNA-binding CsgD family transcriptional regulator